MSRLYIGDFLDGAEKTLCVYRYIDCADDTIKYVGIVRKATLKDRIMAHFCSDEWAKEKLWRVEYFECETQSEVEAFEGHLISLYGTGKYYNKGKASWGLNKYLPDIESEWKPVYKSNALDIETAKEILRFKKLVRENKGGRPKKQIDKEVFEKLCDLQCTIEDLADFFSCSHDTIQRWCVSEYGESFACIHKKHLAKGKASLRRNMFRLSEKNATMAIFLAKNYLGMTDNVEVKADTSLMSALLDVVKGEQK